jgi:hypothetical protein
LIVEWPEAMEETTKYRLSTLSQDASIKGLVDTIKLRWRIERRYEEMKNELGRSHFEGRSWRGFHHYVRPQGRPWIVDPRGRATLVPSGPRRRQDPRLSDRPRPRGAPNPTRATRAQFQLNRPKAFGHRAAQINLRTPIPPLAPV